MNATGTSGRPAESVWDYPRPPRLEADGRHVVFEFAGVRIADTRRSVRMLETSPPLPFSWPRNGAPGPRARYGCLPPVEGMMKG